MTVDDLDRGPTTLQIWTLEPPTSSAIVPGSMPAEQPRRFRHPANRLTLLSRRRADGYPRAKRLLHSLEFHRAPLVEPYWEEPACTEVKQAKLAATGSRRVEEPDRPIQWRTIGLGDERTTIETPYTVEAAANRIWKLVARGPASRFRRIGAIDAS